MTLQAQVASVVKRAIARSTENKLIGWKVEGQVYHNSAINSADCVPLLQQIAVGADSNLRIGDRVTPKRFTVKGMLSMYPPSTLNPYNTLQPIYARIVILSQKNIKVGSAITGGVDAAHLLRPGYAGADQKQFNGDTLDLSEPLNTDLFRVYMDKVVRFAPVQTPATGAGPQPEYGRRWSYTFKSLPSSLTYDEGNGDWNNNFAPFLAIGYAFSDGTAPDLVTQRLVSNVSSFLSFEDA